MYSRFLLGAVIAVATASTAAAISGSFGHKKAPAVSGGAGETFGLARLMIT